MDDLTDDPKYDADGQDDAIEIDFGGTGDSSGDVEADVEVATDEQSLDGADLWDDLPETEIEEGEFDSEFFAEFEDVDADVYDGIPTDEDIGGAIPTEEGTGGEAALEDDDDDVVIEDDDTQFEIGEDDDDFFGVEDLAGWSQQEWSECSSRLLTDARASDDAVLAAKLLAEAGRITEVRLGDADEALRIYNSANQLDEDCLMAIQGIRRLALAGGQLEDFAHGVEHEMTIATDEVVTQRLAFLGEKVAKFLVEDGQSSSGEMASDDPYVALETLTSAMIGGEAERAADAARFVGEAAQDGLFVSTITSAAGLLSEMAGLDDQASGLYQSALEARETEETARVALYRIHASRREWVEAERFGSGIAFAPGSDAHRGLGFFRAALMAMALNDSEQARGLLGGLPDGPPQQLLGLLCSGDDADELTNRFGRFAGSLEEGRLRSIIDYSVSAAAASDPPREMYRSVLQQAPEFGVAWLDAMRVLSSSDEIEHAAMYHALLEMLDDDSRQQWLLVQASLSLMQNGRTEEALRIVERALASRSEPELLLTVVTHLLATGEAMAALALAQRFEGMLEGDDVGEALELLRALVLEFHAEDPDGAAATLAGFTMESTCWPWVLSELAMGAGRGRREPDPDTLDASLQRQDAQGCIPAVLAVVAGNGIPEAERRIDLLSKMSESSPSHLPVFASLRRELLAAGRVETYGEVLERWCEGAAGASSDHLEGERIALLCLSEGSSLGEGELRERLERSEGDTFLPLFLAGLGAYPALSAEAAEKLASGLEGAQADRWWFEAARIWLGVDVHKAIVALDRIEDPGWKKVADTQREAAAWSSRRWDEIAGQLIGAMKEIPEGEISERVLSRMVYVDGILKGEVSMALAEAESLLDAPGSATLFSVRFLMTRLLAQGRGDEAVRSFEVLARSLVGSDESTAYAWLANRVLEPDEATRDRADQLVRDVLEARAADLPLLLLADAQARRRSDPDTMRSVLSEMSGTLEDPRMQGAFLWVLALMFADHDEERALSSAREAHERLTNNPVSALLVEQLAGAREDWATAAMFARQAGSLTRESMFGIEDLLRAGETYRDRLQEGGWAVQCFEQAMSLDPSDPRAFEALREHFTSLGDWDHVASLIEERILVLEDPASRHDLLRDLAYVYEQAGRVEEAIAALRRILVDAPEDPSSLESLGNLCVRTRRWEEAVSVLQERAMLPMEQEQKVEIFTTLGGLYVDQVPDDKRAIVCFEKVIEEGLNDLDVIEQLAGLYEKTGAWEKGLKMAEVMFNAVEDEEKKASWLVMGGRLWQNGAGDTRRAEQSYEMARKQLPAAAEPIVALIELYKSQGDQRALSFQLERSMGDLRHFMQDDPSNLQLYHTVFEIARATEDPLAIRVAGTLIASLYDLRPDEQVKFDAVGGPLAWSPGGWLASEGVDEVISPESFTPSFRVLTKRLKDTLIKSVDYDPKRFGISRSTRLQKRLSADVKLVDEIARWFGIKSPTVHLTDLIPSVLTVLPDNPPLIVIGEPLYRTLDEAQKRFAFGWGCKLAASGLVPFMSLGEAGLPSLWVALMQQFEPSFFISGVDPDETVKLAASLRKNFPKKAREELFGAGLECAGDQLIDVSRLYADMSTYADVGALMACGDISSALQFVWLVSSGEEPFNSDYTAARSLTDSRSLARLVEFVISGRFARGLPQGE